MTRSPGPWRLRAEGIRLRLTQPASSFLKERATADRRLFAVGFDDQLAITGSFYAGGELHAVGPRPGRVRLTLADGTELTDDADRGVALFIGDRPHEPVTVDIYGVDGRLLASHRAF